MFERREKRWDELGPAQRRAVVALGAVQIALQAATLWDLHRRSDQDLRGSRWWWTAASFVNLVGPITYLVVGRRRLGRRGDALEMTLLGSRPIRGTGRRTLRCRVRSRCRHRIGGGTVVPGCPGGGTT